MMSLGPLFQRPDIRARSAVGPTRASAACETTRASITEKADGLLAPLAAAAGTENLAQYEAPGEGK